MKQSVKGKTIIAKRQSIFLNIVIFSPCMSFEIESDFYSQCNYYPLVSRQSTERKIMK